MSYVRFGVGNSDVYIYQDIDFGLRCCWCKLVSPPGGVRSWDTRSRAKMIEHIEEHGAKGHVVPTYVADMLREEIRESGDDSPGDMHRAMDKADAERLRTTDPQPTKG